MYNRFLLIWHTRNPDLARQIPHLGRISLLPLLPLRRLTLINIYIICHLSELDERGVQVGTYLDTLILD